MAKSIHRPEYDVLRRLLREARLGADVTQGALSLALGRSQSFISDIERGVRRLDVLELRDICGLLGLSFPAFLAELEAEIESMSPASRRKKKLLKSKG